LTAEGTAVRRVARAAAAIALATALSGCGGHASSTRAPTQLERAAIQQAIYEFVVAHTEAASPSITKIRVLPHPAGSRGAAPYTAFATVDVFDIHAGFAEALLGFRKKGAIPGWTVLDLGSAEVGCNLGRAVYGTGEQAVPRALDLGCP
jgi:hypothetical protein